MKIVSFFLKWKAAIWKEKEDYVNQFKKAEKEINYFDFWWDECIGFDMEELLTHFLTNEPEHFQNDKVKKEITNILKPIRNLSEIFFKYGIDLFNLNKSSCYRYNDEEIKDNIEKIKTSLEQMYVKKREGKRKIGLIYSIRHEFICCHKEAK